MRFLENASRFSQRGGGTEQTLLPKERRRRRRRVLLAKEEGFSWCTVDSSVLPKIAPKFPLFFFVFFQNGNTLVVVTFFSPLSSSVSPSTKAADEIPFKRTHTHTHTTTTTTNAMRYATIASRFLGFISGCIDLSVSLSLRARACGFRFGQPPLAFHMRTSKTRADGIHRACATRRRSSLSRAHHNTVKLSTSKPASAVTRLAPSFGRYAIRRGDNCLFLFLDIFFLLLYWSTVRGVNTALLASNAH